MMYTDSFASPITKTTSYSNSRIICTMLFTLIIILATNYWTNTSDAFMITIQQQRCLLGGLEAHYQIQNRRSELSHSSITLYSEQGNRIAEGDNINSSPKRKRRRKQQQSTTSPSSVETATTTATSDQNMETPPVQKERQQIEKEELELFDENDGELDLAMMKEIAKFEFQKKDETVAATTTSAIDMNKINKLLEMQQSESSSLESKKSEPTISSAIPLPDIKEARKRKQMEEEMIRLQQEQEAQQKVKIKRTDKEAFRKLLEQQPFADADDSYFEEEQYGAVSALLGERAKPFLSIPLGPLQVGHFIGSLVFVLMAYIEYPGFPLTNLPTPLREAFQGGLGSVYLINTILSILVAVKVAPDRGQPSPLWVMKTFTVGGLAFDQLMQLPTLAEIEKAKSSKGARAIKKKSTTR